MIKYRLCYLVVIIFAINNQCIAQISTQQDIIKELAQIRELIKKHHVAPRIIDQQLAKDILTQFLESIDPLGVYFLQNDIKAFYQLNDAFVTDLQGSTWLVFPKISAVYKSRLEKSLTNLELLTSKPFNLNSKNVLNFDKLSIEYCAASEADNTTKWEHLLCYKVLKGIYQNTEKLIRADELKKLESEARKGILSSEKRKINRVLNHSDGYERGLASEFFDAVLFCQDPHSYYLSQTDHANFVSNLSSETLSFGMDLDEDEFGNVFIDKLAPGAPAWRSGELNKGDVILSIQWDGEQVIDLNGAVIEEVAFILQSELKHKLLITVKKSDVTTKTVSLTKEKMTDGENVVKSFILKGPKKIGYISLPGFYTEWEQSEGSGCANDVAKEVLKLKEEGIEGLILDLRNNGGGALLEGLNLAGIFINEGVLGFNYQNDGKALSMKDANRGTAYDGPLVVMVNKSSASASELVAAALQDYNRAVIVGSTTYGKGTGQKILDLNTTVSNNNASVSKYGFAAITFFKLYRCTGKSIQNKGLRPDIELSSVSSLFTKGESSFPFAFKNDSIVKKLYSQTYLALPISYLADKSKNRTKQIEIFQMIQSINEEKMDKLFGKDSIPLNQTYFLNYYSNINKWWNNLDKQFENAKSAYYVTSTLADQAINKINTYTNENDEEAKKSLSKDLYLNEAFYIINDLINFNTK